MNAKDVYERRYSFDGMERETAEAVARLQVLVKARGTTIHQLALRLGIRPSSFTTGSLDRHWVRIAKHLGVSLDWLLLGDRDRDAENARLTGIIADLTARLQGARPAVPTPSERELVAQRLRDLADELAADATRSRAADVESQLSGHRQKPGGDTENGGRSA